VRALWRLGYHFSLPQWHARGPIALELLAGSLDGCTEAIMLAHGFKVEFLVGLINDRLATAQAERMVRRRASGRSHSLSHHGGRLGALSHLRWP
jgi:hypothetical protein